MNADALRHMLRRQPFVPLEVQLTSGDVYVIHHPEFAMVLETRLILGFPLSDLTVTCLLIHVCRVRELEKVS